jgi:hypothetical protein
MIKGLHLFTRSETGGTVAALLLAAVLLSPASGLGSTIPAAGVFARIEGPDGVQTYAATGVRSTSLASVDVESTPAIFISASLTGQQYKNGGGANINVSQSAEGQYLYYAQIAGGISGASVPIDVDAYLWSSVQADAGVMYSTTSIVLTSPLQQTVAVQLDCNAYGGEFGPQYNSSRCSDISWRSTLSAPELAGTSFYISLSAGVSTTSALGWGTAFADPHVYIDPVFASAHPEYSIIFSEGAGNMEAAAPEPGTFCLLSLVFSFFAVAKSVRSTVEDSQ